MSDSRRRPRFTRYQRHPVFHLSWHLRVLWLARRFVVILFAIFSLTGMAMAQSQSAFPPEPELLPLKAPATLADTARRPKSEQVESAPEKVFTDDDVTMLPLTAISIVGPAPETLSTAKPQAKPADDTAKLAAYWKARFTAARQKLAQDKKALPVLQSLLNVERVQQYSVDETTGQVNSDTYMELLRQIDSTKLAIKNDKQALSDLHDEFRQAGGQPGWIR